MYLVQKSRCGCVHDLPSDCGVVPATRRLALLPAAVQTMSQLVLPALRKTTLVIRLRVLQKVRIYLTGRQERSETARIVAIWV